ncbi:DNA N-6-adenine-methyltransferase [Tautonia sociabilis]|nr:DNA N-6-adenine-methyltransferase [Tautonia sociabilis]
MGKLSAGFDLGADLRTHRRAASLTQLELALRASLAERTVRALEQGSGTLDSWEAALKALGLVLSGRNFPGGETTRKRLATLRRRRGLSQEALARSVGVTKPTIGILEREGRGRLSMLQAVLTVLGAGAYLSPSDGTAAFFTHAGNAPVGQRWETPTELLDALYRVFTRFDLDPCALQKSRTRVKARVHFTEDGGLALPWHGTVFVNPPYGRGLAAWVAKARREVEERRARTVVALLPARPDAAYWHDHVAARAVVYFLRGRLRFSGSEPSAPFPSALAVWGATSDELIGLDKALPEAWRAG